ncbi:MAG: nucleoside deaminase [Muribaculaceae bacterium]|nr:nucleoside deaminase [Muribaculaceae bacterium]
MNQQSSCSKYTEDNLYMQMALDEARRAMDEGEIPIGAVVVSGGRVIGRGHNMTEALNDVTAHAEMMAITSATQTVGGKYLPDATLYVTIEPCLMCAGAIGWAQIGRIVYGAGDSRRGYTTFTQNPFHPKATVTKGVMEEECASLMKTFFTQRR